MGTKIGSKDQKGGGQNNGICTKIRVNLATRRARQTRATASAICLSVFCSSTSDSVITLPKNIETESTPTGRISNDAAAAGYSLLEEHGYFVIETIGSGSFSKVKTAHSKKEEKIVAIKIVSKSRAPTDYLKKFLPREIEVVKGLNHPNIIKYYRCIETTRRVYIIMQFAEHGSLLDRIRAQGQMQEVAARVYYHQLLAAMDYCHQRDVVHRDIKCENLIFDRHDVLKLIDFGFARKFGAAKGGETAPAAGAKQGPQKSGGGGAAELCETYCGSYAYACPQILQGTPYDPHFADIWASGVVLYAMVFGRLPFDDSNYPQLLKEVQMKLNFTLMAGLRPVSQQCKEFISHVLEPGGRRTIRSVYEHPWLEQKQAAETTAVKVGNVLKV